MNDQAESLRRIVDQSIDNVKQTKVVSIISGKGGVGKSNFAINFSIELQKLGKKVILFDLDIGMANVDILMGLSSSYSIVDMLENEMSIWNIVEEGPLQLSYISGGSGLATIFQLDPIKMSRFTSQLELLNERFDYIIFDMGAGASNDSLQFILSANETILVTTSEPTSITDAYAMIKYIHRIDSDLPCRIVVNRCDSDEEGKDTVKRLQTVAYQFLRKELLDLGMIPNDKTVLKAVKSQTPFTIYEPNSKASKAIKLIAGTYVGEISENSVPPFLHFLSKFKGYFAKKKR